MKGKHTGIFVIAAFKRKSSVIIQLNKKYCNQSCM